jgi:hypothetical protein
MIPQKKDKSETTVINPAAIKVGNLGTSPVLKYSMRIGINNIIETRIPMMAIRLGHGMSKQTNKAYLCSRLNARSKSQ